MMVVFGIAVALEFISVLFQFSHWATFASDGVGVPGLLGFGQGGCPVPLLPCPLAPPSTSTLDVCTSSWEYSDGVRIPSGVCGLPGHPGPRVDHHLPHPPPPLAFHKCVRVSGLPIHFVCIVQPHIPSSPSMFCTSQSCCWASWLSTLPYSCGARLIWTPPPVRTCTTHLQA